MDTPGYTPKYPRNHQPARQPPGGKWPWDIDFPFPSPPLIGLVLGAHSPICPRKPNTKPDYGNTRARCALDDAPTGEKRPMGVAEKNKGLPGIDCPTPVDASCVESAVSCSSTTMRHATCPSEQKVAKLRYQQFIYMTNADIVILHPFLLSHVGCLPLVDQREACRRLPFDK